MTFTIAITGKGGTGKTTVAALLINFFRKNFEGSILAIDADPNNNLHEALGLNVSKTVGDIREEILQSEKYSSPSMSKESYLEYLIYGEVVVEANDFDLIAMGRPEGPGCYCYVNHLLRKIIDNLAKNYRFVIMDTEAGLEHISRRTTRNIDVMLITTDISIRSLRTAKRIRDLAISLETKTRNFYVVVNRASQDMLPLILEELNKMNLELIGVIPEDPLVLEYDFKGKPLIDLPPHSPAIHAVANIVEKLKQLIQ